MTERPNGTGAQTGSRPAARPLEDLLARDGKLVYKIKGVSMEPMLRQDRDLVIIRVPASRLKKYDVALYKRGSSYVLHRVIAVREDRYLIRGDNTYVLEHVPKRNVIGIVTHILRGEKVIEMSDPAYQTYVASLNRIYPLRKKLWQLRRSISEMLYGLYGKVRHYTE